MAKLNFVGNDFFSETVLRKGYNVSLRALHLVQPKVDNTTDQDWFLINPRQNSITIVSPEMMKSILFSFF
jgi:hypothetical protein